MSQERHFRINYVLKGTYKTFYLCAQAMNNAEAWHWATIDAGIGQLPKYRNDPVTKLSKPQAEKHGVTNVEWSEG